MNAACLSSALQHDLQASALLMRHAHVTDLHLGYFGDRQHAANEVAGHDVVVLATSMLFIAQPDFHLLMQCSFRYRVLEAN